MVNRTLQECLLKVKDEAINLGEEIFRNPELGFKEKNTVKEIKKLLNKYNLNYTDNLAITGLKATLDSGKPGPHIGLVCELDAVPTLNHAYCNKEDNAAHSCAHHGQVAVMVGLFIAINESNILKDLCGKISLIATPAEEYCDFTYRKELVAEGKLKYMSGKQEMIFQGVFDDIDMVLSCHTMGTGIPYDMEVNSSLNGFLGKRATFKGQAAHAGAFPSEGINALNAATLSMSAMNFLRETFKEEDAIRLHFILTEGGTSVNTVPERAVIDMYIRGKTLEAILDVNKKVDRALRAGALAIGCELEISNEPGYLPLTQDLNLSKLVEETAKEFISEERILRNCHSFASGDIGDLSQLIPTIQVGVGGYQGRIHGHDFKTKDFEVAYITPMYYLGESVIKLLENDGKKALEIKNNYKPLVNKAQYLELLDKSNEKQKYKVEV